jgi:hypothetical protein
MSTRIDQTRYQFDDTLTAETIRELVGRSRLRVLQCVGPVRSQTWDRLNDEFFTRRADVNLRVYGFYGEVCDLSFLSRLRNVESFSANCLLHAKGIEYLEALESLRSLEVGIYDLQDFEFLAVVPAKLSHLSLEATKSRKPRLNLLKRFSSLKSLYLERQENQIEVLAELRTVDKLTLRSISKSRLEFLERLDNLWSLEIKLGGTSDLSAIAGRQSIKYLELWKILGLKEIGVISTLTGLQFLFLQSLKNVRSLPDLSRLPKLKRVWLEDLKGLEDLSALEQAPALEELVHTSARNMHPNQYANLLLRPNLKRVSVGFSSERKRREFGQLRSAAGIEEYSHCPFAFS